MEIFDVPKVMQLPDLTEGKENPAAFADMVLTQLLRYDCARLEAEQPWYETQGSGVSWFIHPKEPGIFSRQFEGGVSPSCQSFRLSLDYIRQHYIGPEMLYGCVDRTLRQDGVVRNCTVYFSATASSGYWIKIYVMNRALL